MSQLMGSQCQALGSGLGLFWDSPSMHGFALTLSQSLLLVSLQGVKFMPSTLLRDLAWRPFVKQTGALWWQLPSKRSSLQLEWKILGLEMGNGTQSQCASPPQNVLLGFRSWLSTLTVENEKAQA